MKLCDVQLVCNKRFGNKFQIYMDDAQQVLPRVFLRQTLPVRLHC